MRLLRAVVAALTMLGTGSAVAQVPDTLFTGTARPITSTGPDSWCALEVGPSLFQRQNAKRALITLPPLYYAETSASGGIYYGLFGQGRMVFANATSGTVKFLHPKAYPHKILTPKFTQYTETYNAAKGTLSVRFRLKFPGCNIVVLTDY